MHEQQVKLSNHWAEKESNHQFLFKVYYDYHTENDQRRIVDSLEDYLLQFSQQELLGTRVRKPEGCHNRKSLNPTKPNKK
jgi:hypothetical protein